MEAASHARFIEENQKREEIKRRKREAIVILITTLMVAALIYLGEADLREEAPAPPSG